MYRSLLVGVWLSSGRSNVKVPHLARCEYKVCSHCYANLKSQKNCFWIISWYVLSMSTNTLLTPCKARCGTFTLLPSLLPARCEYGVCSHWNSSRRQCTARCFFYENKHLSHSKQGAVHFSPRPYAQYRWATRLQARCSTLPCNHLSSYHFGVTTQVR